QPSRTTLRVRATFAKMKPCPKRAQMILSIEDIPWPPSSTDLVGGCTYIQALVDFCEHGLVTSWLLQRRRRLRKHEQLSITTYWVDFHLQSLEAAEPAIRCAS